MTLFTELTEAGNIHPEPGEVAGEFAIRLVAKVDAVCEKDEDVWLMLSDAAQRWVNDTLALVDDHKDDQNFLPEGVPGFIATPGEPKAEKPTSKKPATSTPKADNWIEVHEFARLFPPMDADQFEELTEDIHKNGLRQPIMLYEKKILDGVHRYKACIAADVRPRFAQFNGDEIEALNYVVSLNLRRRNLDKVQRSMIASKIADLRKGQHKEEGKLSLEEAAKQMDVSVRSAARARSVLYQGVEELKDAVEDKAISLEVGAEIARKPKVEQKKEVQRRTGGKVRAKPKKKPRTVPPLNSLSWSEASEAQRRKFIDSVGYRSVWAMFTKDQRLRCINLGA
jgi:ParB-like chromosome segregation protein Spo0J